MATKKKAAKKKPAAPKGITIKISAAQMAKLAKIEKAAAEFDGLLKAGNLSLENGSDLCKWFEKYQGLLPVIKGVFFFSKVAIRAITVLQAALKANCSAPPPEDAFKTT